MSSNIRQDPLFGHKLGDYTVQSLIGRGGMARVYRGLDENLNRPAAVKVVQITPSDDDRRVIDRFKLEARAIASFDHPNIVSIYQFGAKDNMLFIAMKLVEGKTLSQLLREMRRKETLLPVEKVLSITNDVSQALDYAHARNIIHRDVKPSNILFDTASNNRAVITDFGLALEIDSDDTMGTAFGTPRYISPEQAVSSQNAVPQSDVYSLAVVVYEMLTGKVPFEDESPMSVALYHITSEPPPPRTINPKIPQAVEDTLLHALKKDPVERYARAGEFYKALEAAFKSNLPNAPRTPVAPPIIKNDVADPPTERPQKRPQPATPKPAPKMQESQEEPAVQPKMKIRRRRRRVGCLPALLMMIIVVGSLLSFWWFNGQSLTMPDMVAVPIRQGADTLVEQARSLLGIEATTTTITSVVVPEATEEATPTATETIATETEIPVPTATNTEQPTVTVEPTATTAPTETANSTATPSASPLPPPTETGDAADAPLPSPIPSLPEGVTVELQLRYDDEQFIIKNTSQYTLPLDGLTLEWASYTLDASTEFRGTLPPMQCGWIHYQASGTLADQPEQCPPFLHSNHRLTNAAEIFWADAFMVIFNGEIIATCQGAEQAQDCTITLP